MQSDKFSKVMSFGILVFGPIFAFILFFTNPDQGIYQIVAFFISLFVLTMCSFTLGLYLIKRKAQNNELLFTNIKNSVRQGLTVAFFVVTVLAMGMIKLLTWWDVLLLAFALISLELYFKSDKAGV